MICTPFLQAQLIYFFFQAPGYEELITALYLKGDSYLMSDPVFGVKSSLIVVGFFFFSKLLSLFSFMLTLSSGTQINRWSFDHESTRLQGTKTSCVSEAWLCVGDSRRMRWITKESWSKLTRLSVYLRFLTYPWSYLYIMFFYQNFINQQIRVLDDLPH